VGCVELSEEFDVRVFSLKAKSVGIVGKDIGTPITTKPVLVNLDALRNDNSFG
jgi:hypothetical protein